MGLLRKNETGSYKLIFRTYSKKHVGDKIEVGLGTKNPVEAKARAMITLRALHLAGLTQSPTLNIAVVADNDANLAVDSDWVEDQITSSYYSYRVQSRRDIADQLREITATIDREIQDLAAAKNADKHASQRAGDGDQRVLDI